MSIMSDFYCNCIAFMKTTIFIVISPSVLLNYTVSFKLLKDLHDINVVTLISCTYILPN